MNYTPLAIVLPLIFGIWYLVRPRTATRGRCVRWKRTRSPAACDDRRVGAAAASPGRRIRLRGLGPLIGRVPAERLEVNSAHQTLERSLGHGFAEVGTALLDVVLAPPASDQSHRSSPCGVVGASDGRFPAAAGPGVEPPISGQGYSPPPRRPGSSEKGRRQALACAREPRRPARSSHPQAEPCPPPPVEAVPN